MPYSSQWQNKGIEARVGSIRDEEKEDRSFLRSLEPLKYIKTQDIIGLAGVLT